MNIFVPIIIIVVLSIITLLLLAIDQLIGGSAEKKITINNSDEILVTETDTLLNALSKMAHQQGQNFPIIVLNISAL